MCDEGRLNYKFVNTDRVTACRVDRNGEKIETSMENAISEVKSILGMGTISPEASDKQSVQKPGLFVVVSATCTLEEMHLSKRLAAGYPAAKLYAVRHVADGEEDQLLRKSDRHPNTKGAELLGIPVVDATLGSVEAFGEPLPDGTVVLAVGFDYETGESLEKFFEKFSKIAIIAARESNLTTLANVLIPGLTFAEKEGLIVNFQGRVQKLEPALDGLWDKIAPWEVMAKLVSAVNGESAVDTISGLRAELARDNAVFSNIDLNSVGSTGVGLEEQPV